MSRRGIAASPSGGIMAPKPVQIVLQGGGAKIFALIAALDALHRAAGDGKILIQRIAGTSAGAIVGSLYAAGIDPATIREAFRGFPLDRLMCFRGHRKIGAIGRALWGSAIADDRPLAGLLDRLLRWKLQPVRRSDPVFLHELRTPMLMVASDVSGRRPIIYDSLGEGAHLSVVNCAMDSCAIPFFFRPALPGARALILDGGLCENLPSDRLVAGTAQYGEVIAISFVDDVPSSPQTPTQLAVALLETAMNASVRRSKVAGNIFLIELDPGKIGTFDFDLAHRALTEGSSEFNRAFDTTTTLLNEYCTARGHERVSKSRWENADPITMGQLLKIYYAQQLARPFKYFKRQVIITAYSLLSKGEEGYGERDRIEYALEFAPSRYSIDSIAAQISVDKGQKPSDVTCSVYDDRGQIVPIEAIPIRDSDNDSTYGLMICFTPPLDPPGGRYTLSTEFRMQQAFPGLIPPKDVAAESSKPLRDEMGSKMLRADGPVDRVELIARIPNSFGEVKIGPRPSSGPIHSMTQSELWPLRGSGLGHFKVYGWCADGVPSGSSVGIEIRPQ
jgi:NTE family protein